MAVKGTFQQVDVENVDTSINQALGVTPQGATDTKTNQTIAPVSDVAVPESGMQGKVEGTQTEPPLEETKVSGTNLNLGNYYQQTAPLVSSWENRAEAIAGTQFQQNVLAGKQTLTKSAQEAQREGQEMQTQLALGEYMRAQSAEKAGWTGGYMLDQKRQGDYLRASIQAQMYGAQELQKYGMETQLEAARLAYDLGKEQLAYQMYQEAQQLAVTEAQMFGYYVSPEIRDMVNQYNAATTALADNPDDERAKTVKATLDEWFSKEGMSPSDLSKFGRITMEREQWNQAKLDAVLASIGDDPSTFLMRDEQGRYVTDPASGQYVKMNFEDVTTADFLDFIKKDDNSTNKFADTAFRSYAKYLAQSTINAYFSSLGEGVTPTEAGYKAFVAIAGNDRLQAYLNELGLEPEDKAMVEGLLAQNFNPSLTRGGVTISYGEVRTTSSTSPSGTQANQTEVIVDENNPDSVYTTYKNPYNNETLDGNRFKENFKDYAKRFNLDLPADTTKFAEEFKKIYESVGVSFAKEIPEDMNYVDWAKNLHNSHHFFVGGNYTDHIKERIITHFSDKVGFELELNKFSSSGTRSGLLEIKSDNLSAIQKDKLKELGFGEYTYNGKKYMNTLFTRPDNSPTIPGSLTVNDWNNKYVLGADGKRNLEYWLYTLLKGDSRPLGNLTNTAEGEGRF